MVALLNTTLAARLYDVLTFCTIPVLDVSYFLRADDSVV